MRTTLLSVLTCLFLNLPTCAAQDSVAGSVTHPLPGGLTIALPQTWRPVDAVTEQRVRATIDTLFPKVKDSPRRSSCGEFWTCCSW